MKYKYMYNFNFDDVYNVGSKARCPNYVREIYCYVGYTTIFKISAYWASIILLRKQRFNIVKLYRKKTTNYMDIRYHIW